MDPYYSDDLATLYHGDCRSWPQVQVDAIITDPPYEAAAVESAWTWLPTAAATLRPGGWLIAYSGHVHLPAVMRALECDHLAYQWTLSARYEGGGQVFNRDDMTVLTEWKPILAYRRRPFGTARGHGGRFVAGGDRHKFRDLLGRGGREKGHHDWAQPIAEAHQLVEMFSRPGETVLDPFAGSGTIPRAALDLGRRAIAIELDEAHCAVAAERLGGPIRTTDGAFDFGGVAS